MEAVSLDGRGEDLAVRAPFEELGQVDVLEGEIAEVPAEGTLAPDSYEVSRGDTRASLIERL